MGYSEIDVHAADESHPHAGAPEARVHLGSAVALAGIALTRYAVVGLPFELGLVVNAATIVVIVAVVALSAWRGILAGLVEMPGPVRLGLAAYLAAAVWGAAVGLLSGNSTRYLAGQLLSMLLLPAAAVAFAAHRRYGARTFMAALTVAALLAAAVQVVVPFIAPALVDTLDGSGTYRLRFRTGLAGPGLVLLLFGAARASSRDIRFAALAVGIGAMHVAWGLSRGSWVAAGCGLACVVVLRVAGRGMRPRVAAAAAGALVTSVGVLMLVAPRATSPTVASRTFDGSQQDLAEKGLAPSSESYGGEQALAITVTEETGNRRLLEGRTSGAAAVRASLWFSGAEDGKLVIWLEALDDDGTRLHRAEEQAHHLAEWSHATVSLRWPPAATRFAVGIRVARGRWLVDDLEVSEVPQGPSTFSGRLLQRLGTLPGALVHAQEDDTLRYRMLEVRAVWSRWSRAGVVRLLAGHGLGAEFPFGQSVWVADGRAVRGRSASYIHNLYVFFAFKLGVAGILALAGLVLIAGWSWLQAWRSRDHSRSWPLIATAAVWCSVLVWSITSPEVINFAAAPLLGAMTAALRGGRSLPAGRQCDGAAPGE